MKTFLSSLVVLFALATIPAHAQTSNVLLVSQDANKVITVIDVADPGLSGSWLSFSSQISTTGVAVENKLFSGLAANTAILIRIDSNQVMSVLVVNDPGFFQYGLPLGGQFVFQGSSLIGAVSTIKDKLYRGL